MNVSGKTVLVTGASSGIGKEIALLFARKGSTIIATARDMEGLQSVAEEIRSEGGTADCAVMDIGNRSQVQEVLSSLIKKQGIDILINNAGIARWGSIEEVSYEDFDEQIAINLVGSFNCIKEIVPHLVSKGSGCIINIISSTVKNTKANRVAYAASKYGQAGLSNAVHADLKNKGIRVVAIYPRKTDTPIHDLPADDPQRKEMLDPKAVAAVVLKAVASEDDASELSI